ncbi:MAG TPA: sulfatase [Methylomirabilota bacterium]|nr:sulfatase [Methylomirabilota bacterium]
MSAPRLVVAVAAAAMLVRMMTVLAAPGDGASPRMNVVLVTVDCLRPDRLGHAGHRGAATPNLDRFAGEAVEFADARATAPWTLPALVSLLTGAYPSSHGMDARGRSIADIPHLPKILQGVGYRVPALATVTRQPGMEALQVEGPAFESPETDVGQHLIEWLRTRGRGAEPFFAWDHWRALHLPYDAGPDGGDGTPGIPDTPGVRQVRTCIVIPAELQSFIPSERDAVVRLYDAELERVDAAFGRLLATLEAAQLAGRTVVVVTADHGEELFDHGLLGHASTTERATLYDEVLRVPLLLRIPGVGRQVVGCPVSQVDLMPTLLPLLGLEAPPGVEGIDLGPLLRGGSCPTRALFAESLEGGYQAWGPSARRFLWAVLDDGVKLIERRSWDGEVQRELYRLADDPGERRDLSVGEPEAVAALAELLAAHVASHGGPDAWKRPLVETTPEQRDRPRHLRRATVPRFLEPEDDERVSFADRGGRLAARWTGSPVVRYVVEYDVGEEPSRLRGTFEVAGTEVAYGPFSADMWSGMAQLNPWRFRVWPKADPQRASEWVVVRLEP